MGKSEGWATLAVNTFSIPDDIVVSYEGMPIVSTGCFGTIGLVGCTQSGIHQACCDGGGECDLRFRYGPGSSTTLNVTVTPNCSGTADTQWVFELLCPQ